MKRKHKLQRIILYVCMFLLCYPLFEFFTPIRLAGSVSRGGQAGTIEEFNDSTWFNGTFQESFMNYMNDEIGLFPFFVRVHNQIEYSLFGNIHTGEVIAGKENYLYEKPYINTYFGKDFLGMEKIERFTGVMKALQDTLKTMDKIVLYGFATGKASYYPEYLPYTEPMDSTNHEYMVKSFKENGINHIDFIPWFLEMKDTLGYLLFPQYGIHWSHYSTVLATDSMVKYIEAKTGWDLPNLTITARDSSPVAKYFDNDISQSMNLFKALQPKPMVYPEFHWDKTKKTKKLLVIGDSFFWDLFENVHLKECFEEVQFWYYNQAVYDKTIEEGRSNDVFYLSRHMDLYKILNEYDAFLILSNEPNIVHRGWGIPKEALLTLKDSTHIRKERQNEFLERVFVKKPGMQKELSRLAKERGVTLEEMEQSYMHDRDFKF